MSNATARSKARGFIVFMAAGLLVAAAAWPARAQLATSAYTDATDADALSNGSSVGTATAHAKSHSIAFGPPSSTGFTSRYAAQVCSEVHVLATSRTDTFTQSPNYKINFTVTAPSGTSYQLQINTSLSGDIDQVHNAGSINPTSNLTAITGSVTAGPALASGTLSLSPTVSRSGSSTGSTAISQNNNASPAIINGAGTGLPVTHQLSFNWTQSCSSSIGFNVANFGDECGLRLGLACGLGGTLNMDPSAGDYPGPVARTAATDGHFVTAVLHYCGDGNLDNGTGGFPSLGEQCDLGASNGVAGSCCSASCKFTTGNICRAAVSGGCDVAELCSGSSAACPADAVKPVNTICRSAVPGGCDIDEVCNGINTICPADSVQPSGTPCRPAIDECDATDVCNGTNTCPADLKQPINTPCTDDGNPCSQDKCDGVNNACQHPAGNGGASCRALQGECDIPEVCSGVSVFCPADAKKANGTACSTDSNPCTLDQCDGSNNACQHPAGNAGVQCRASGGVCDPAEQCDGTHTACPADAKSSSVCRPAAGACDVPDSCDGVNNNCPADALKPSGTSCRAPAGVCDVEEFCSGSSPNCPDDAKSTEVCRPEAGFCDVQEVCDGFDDDCPTDLFRPSSLVCRTSVGVCDLTETCTGSAAACPTDLKSTAQCHVASDLCDKDDFCDGVVNDCPEGVKPSGSVCRGSLGACDPAEVCNGVDLTCPPDVKSVNICRPAADFCDVDEFCDGVNNVCPPNTFKPGSVECRASAGFCDVAENCTGSSASCPPNVFKPSTTPCRAQADQCDVAENCTGSAALCPTDLFAANGTACTDATTPDPNTCLNACDTGVCTPGNPVTQSACCGNGIIDAGETCDDGNQANADSCPSSGLNACKLVSTGTLIRGTKTNPAHDKKACQLEFYVVNPNNPVDRFSLPSAEQKCVDQDPTCDFDARSGHCGFTVVVCLNNTDPNLGQCTPKGVSSIEVVPPRPRLYGLSIINQLNAANTAVLRDAVTALLDPTNLGAGFTNSPPLSAGQQGFCSQPIQLDVLSGAAVPNNPRVAAQLIKIKTRDGSMPIGRLKTSQLHLVCGARPLP